MSDRPVHVRLTDTTLRDGSHAVSHRFTEDQVRQVVRGLDGAGVPVIEVSHGDGLGGSSYNYGFSVVDEGRLLAAAVDEGRLLGEDRRDASRPRHNGRRARRWA